MTNDRSFAKTETVMQIEATECGAACLAMILRYFGQHVSLDQMRIETDVSRDGCNAGNISRAAEARGLACHGYRRDPDDLDDITPPNVIWWDYNHFVVYEGRKGNTIYINDPAFGRRKISGDEFANKYSGIILEFEPKEDFAKAAEYGNYPGGSSVKDFARSIPEGFRTRAIMVCAAFIMSGVCGVLAAMLLSKTSVDTGLRMVLCCCLIAMMLVIERWGSKQKGMQMNAAELNSSHRFLSILFSLPPSFFEQRYPGDAVARVQKNNRLNRFTVGELSESISDMTVSIICLAAMAAVRPAIGIIALACASAEIATKAVELYCNRQLKIQAAIEAAQTSRIVFTGLCRASSIINAGCANMYADKAVNSFHRQSMCEKGIFKIQNTSTALRLTVYIMCACFMAFMCKTDTSFSTEMITVLMLFGMFVIRTEKILMLWQHIDIVNRDRQLVEDTECYSESFFEKTGESSDDFRKLYGNIELTDVFFSYLKFGQPIVGSINMSIPSGSIIGITGGTGSGKTTLGKLLSGMRSPTSGRITYDGKALEDIPKKVITASISTVPQKPVLFTGTVRDNITLWNSSISDSAVDRATRDACIKEIIMERSGGYEYVIGERGKGFSGGEQQRIEIARALATDPSVLILDEGTSGLDDDTAKQVMNNIKKRGCTTIYITQKKHVLDICDKVLDLDSIEDTVK